MATKITKTTKKGQITLPKAWRGQFKTDNFVLQISTQQIVITPIHLEDIEEAVIFDAERDNGGKGITPDEIIKTLKKIRRG